MASSTAAPPQARPAVTTAAASGPNGSVNGHVSGPQLGPDELADWLEALDDLLDRHGPEAVREVLAQLQTRASGRGAPIVPNLNTPYVNSIPAEFEPEFPGHRAVERNLRSIRRRNAMAMVVQ